MLDAQRVMEGPDGQDVGLNYGRIYTLAGKRMCYIISSRAMNILHEGSVQRLLWMRKDVFLSQGLDMVAPGQNISDNTMGFGTIIWSFGFYITLD